MKSERFYVRYRKANKREKDKLISEVGEVYDSQDGIVVELQYFYSFNRNSQDDKDRTMNKSLDRIVEVMMPPKKSLMQRLLR